MYKNFNFPINYKDYHRDGHPALKVPFDVLYQELKNRVYSGELLSSSNDSGLEIFKYTKDTFVDFKWDYFTLLARGIIVSQKEQRVVAYTFPKFFNYGEQVPISLIFDTNFVATEKIDGSMGTLFYYDNRWQIATMGSFSSDQAIWANSFLHKNINTNELDINSTYLLEIVYPESRIVIPYNFEKLFLLAIYTNGIEQDVSTLQDIAKKCNFQLPKYYDFNDLNKYINFAKTMKFDKEGFVIRFHNGCRIKIKGDEYCKVHRIVSKATPLCIWDKMYNNVDLNNDRNELPEELQKDYDLIVNILNNQANKLYGYLSDACCSVKHLSDKELGLELSNPHSIYFKDPNINKVKNLIFANRKNPNNADLRKRILKLIRPVNNVLEGYCPSSVINRF